MFAWIRNLGQFIATSAESAGYGVHLAADATRSSPTLLRPRRIRDVLNLLYTYTVIALPVTMLVSVVIGMILAMGMGVVLVDFNQESRIGWLVAAITIREMGPLMTAFILAASLGSGVAAEIGTMRVSEEIDALEVMAIPPIRFLILPRLVALILLTPVMTVFANALGILGGALIAKFQFGVSFTTYQLQAKQALELRDLYQSLIKGAIFGVIIATVGCTQGMRTAGGATGVGQSTRRAVVVSFLLVLCVSYFISWLIYRIEAT